MRKEIIAALFDPLDELDKCTCDGSAAAIKEYLRGVRKTGIWPLKKERTMSNDDVMGSIGITHWKCEMPPKSCITCRRILGGMHIRQLQQDIRTYWHGLCLDCMDISNPRTGCIDSDYWLHNEDRKWDRDCDITHGRNTWYFSFMGRAEIMETRQREQKERKAQASRSANSDDST
jgi:hypothetical protein